MLKHLQSFINPERPPNYTKRPNDEIRHANRSEPFFSACAAGAAVIRRKSTVPHGYYRLWVFRYIASGLIEMGAPKITRQALQR
jgi:hypothetical protein